MSATASTLPNVSAVATGSPRSGHRSVCIITQNQSFGGMEVHTLGLMRTLIERGYRVELVSNRYDRYDEIVRRNGWETNVRTIHTDLDGILYGRGSDRAGWRAVFATLESETLVFPKGNYNFGQIGFLRECRRAFKTIVFIEHLEPYERPQSSRKWMGVVPGVGLWWKKRKVLSRFGSRYADRIIAVSGRVRDRLVGDIGYPAGKLSVVRNGVPWQDFERTAARTAAFRAQYGIAPEVLVFGMLARLTRDKGIDIALHAVRRLIDAQPSRRFCLVIAGEGYLGDELKALSRELGLDDVVKFIGFVKHPEDLLAGYDVILFSSRVEGLPLGLLQGMAAGCIPIVTRISGMPEAVDSPEVGWVVEPESADGVCNAMRAVLSLDDAAVMRAREQARRRVRDQFDIAESNRQLVELCESAGKH